MMNFKKQLVRAKSTAGFTPYHFEMSLKEKVSGISSTLSNLLRLRLPHNEVQSDKGFTLIEMVVVVAVIVVITGTVLANNSKFGGVVQLENLAYDIALSTREAQIYGVSVKRFQGNYSAPFGVHYDLAYPYRYTIFADAVPTNNVYNCTTPGTTDCEDVQSTTITRGFYIGKFCVTDSGGEHCSDTTPSLTKLDVIYKHPEPDAYIYVGGVQYLSARVVVTSPRGDTMSIVVENNGQISVHSTNAN